MDGLVEAISWASSTLWVSFRLWTAEKIMRCLKIGLKNAPTDVAAGFGVIHGGSTKLVVAVRLCAPPTSYGIVVKVSCGQDAFVLNHWR